MPTTTTTHINFDGNAREALEFYAQASGGKAIAISYRDAHYPLQDDADLDRIMWGQAEGPGGFRVMAFDVRSEQSYDPGSNSFFVSLRSSTEEECRALWDGLSEGGTIVQDLGSAPWSPLYGMVTDRFGVTWVVDVVAQSA